MRIIKRADSLYVVDDGRVLRLAAQESGKLKRWKCHTKSRELANKHAAIIKTDLMKGIVQSDRAAKVPSFREWA